MQDYRCPCESHSTLTIVENAYVCADFNRNFPVVRGIPILIDEPNSVFAVDDYLTGSSYAGESHFHSATGFRYYYRKLIRSVMDSQPKRRGFDSTSAVNYVCSKAKNTPPHSGGRGWIRVL